MTFTTKIKPWGNSLGITLPKEELIRRGLDTGSFVEVLIKKKTSIASAHGALPSIKKDMKVPVEKFLAEIKNDLESKW